MRSIQKQKTFSKTKEMLCECDPPGWFPTAAPVLGKQDLSPVSPAAPWGLELGLHPRARPSL